MPALWTCAIHTVPVIGTCPLFLHALVFLQGWYVLLVEGRQRSCPGKCFSTAQTFHHIYAVGPVYVIVCAVKGNLALSVLFPVRQLVLNGSITGNLPLWFLLTLFICRILLNLIGKTKGWVLALCLLSLVAAFLMHLANFDHPYYLANTMTGLTFMCLGYIVKKNYPPRSFSPQSHYMPSPFYTRLLLGCGQTPSITAIIWLGYWGQWQASLS